MKTKSESRQIQEEFEVLADRWTEHNWSKTPTMEEHLRVRIMLMAREIRDLRAKH
jgi:hypothetical protein